MSNEIRLPKPLFQDPVFGAPTDPVIVRNEEEEMLYLFFTQRRATDIYVGASWVHGTKIGVGRTDYDSDEVQNALGKRDMKPVVHYDFLYLE